MAGGASSTRRDYIIANPAMLPMITGFHVEPTSDYLTHSVVQVTFAAQGSQEEIMMQSKLGSLSDLLKNQIKEATAACDTDKEKQEIEEKVKEELAQSIEKRLQEKEQMLITEWRAENVDGMWKSWSAAVEKGWVVVISTNSTSTSASVSSGVQKVRPC